MRLIYTKHAKLRVNQRYLSSHHIEETIRHPDREVPADKGCIAVQKSFGAKTLEVVYSKNNYTIIILTAYWLKEV